MKRKRSSVLYVLAFLTRRVLYSTVIAACLDKGLEFAFFGALALVLASLA